MRVLVTGGTGFLGAPLCRALRAEGHAVTVVTRDPEHAGGTAVGWDAVDAAVRDADALVNFAGEPITAGRWTAARKARIATSRVEGTRTLVHAIAAAERRPSILVSASAIGYYGARGDEPVDETGPAGSGFLADVCRAWEAEAIAAEALGVRVVRLRIGIALASDGGALDRMQVPFRAFLGGPVGSGRQWMSWVHRDDVIGLVLGSLEDARWTGPVNATAPQPVTNAEFAQALGRALARPARVRTPAFALRLGLGKMADLLLTGQRVVPAVAERLGYQFRYRDIGPALRVTARR